VVAESHFFLVSSIWADYNRCVETDGVGGEIPCKRGWGGFHADGMYFAACDGSVHFFRTNIDLTIFGNLATIAGGEQAAVP
jgi:hypothetical protein